MIDKIFVDTNVWIYLFLQDDDKKYKYAENFFRENGVKSTFLITFQIINEVSNTLLRHKYQESEIRQYIKILCKMDWL